jgi:septal ring factor EnvC (AmiA/AmiB activator)
MKLFDLMEEPITPPGQQPTMGAEPAPQQQGNDPAKAAAMQQKANQDRKKQLQTQIKQAQEQIKMQQDQLKMLQSQLASIK